MRRVGLAFNDVTGVGKGHLARWRVIIVHGPRRASGPCKDFRCDECDDLAVQDGDLHEAHKHTLHSTHCIPCTRIGLVRLSVQGSIVPAQIVYLLVMSVTTS